MGPKAEGYEELEKSKQPDTDLEDDDVPVVHKKNEFFYDKFQKTTQDACILAITRLTECCCRGHSLSFNDIMGYSMCILLYMFSFAIQITITLLFYGYTVEYLEDPFEKPDVKRGAFNLLKEVLQTATCSQLLINEAFYMPLPPTIGDYTSQHPLPPQPACGYHLNVSTYLQENPTVMKLNPAEQGHVNRICKGAINDWPQMHFIFCMVFCAIVLTEFLSTMKTWGRIIRIADGCLMEQDDPNAKEGEEEDCDDEEDEDANVKRWSINSTEANCGQISYMNPFAKLIVSVFIFLPKIFFLYMLFWTFGKFLYLLTNVLSVAKSCLKLGFVMKFGKLVFSGFMPPAVTDYMGNGGFKTPKRLPDHCPLSGAINSLLDVYHNEDRCCEAMWQSCLSMVATIITAFCMSGFLALNFSHAFETKGLCKAYHDAVGGTTTTGWEVWPHSDIWVQKWLI